MLNEVSIKNLLQLYKHAQTKKMWPYHVADNIVEIEEVLKKPEKKANEILKSFSNFGTDGNPKQYFLYEYVRNGVNLDPDIDTYRIEPVITEFNYRGDEVNNLVSIEELCKMIEFKNRRIYYGYVYPEKFKEFNKQNEELSKSMVFSINGNTFLEEGEELMAGIKVIDIPLSLLSINSIKSNETRLEDEKLIQLVIMMKKLKISYDSDAKKVETPIVQMNIKEKAIKDKK